MISFLKQTGMTRIEAIRTLYITKFNMVILVTPEALCMPNEQAIIMALAIEDHNMMI